MCQKCPHSNLFRIQLLYLACSTLTIMDPTAFLQDTPYSASDWLPSLVAAGRAWLQVFSPESLSPGLCLFFLRLVCKTNSRRQCLFSCRFLPAGLLPLLSRSLPGWSCSSLLDCCWARERRQARYPQVRLLAWLLFQLWSESHLSRRLWMWGCSQDWWERRVMGTLRIKDWVSNLHLG